MYYFSDGGVIRGYHSLALHVSEADLEHPERVTSTQLRKYFATMTQCLNLSTHQLQHCVDHLGHSTNVHEIHYRQLSETLERTEIAKLCLIQDMGLVAKYKDKRLQDIELPGNK